MTKYQTNQETLTKNQVRNSLLTKTRAEIEDIAAEFHARMPRESAQSVGAIYARYSTRFQQSIGDQVRVLFEEAERQNIFIPTENVFFDTAQKGYSNRRPGLNALREALEQKQFDVLLVFATNRLFRKTYKSLQFVEEELVERGVRCIFVKSYIDTADEKRWRFRLQVHATFDEAVVSMYAAHVRAAHEGLFLKGMICTSLPLGYAGQVVEGEVTKRKRPRRRIVVDKDQAEYVREIFTWYTKDGLAIAEIAQRLNADPAAPAPPKSPSGVWSHRSVRYLLSNACYRGEWSYGRTETKWQSKKDYARQVERSEPLKVEQFEHLRIVSDETWYAAQARLLENESQAGRRSKDGDGKRRPRVLNGLFYCPKHNRPLYVGGGYGRNMFCKDCRALPASDRAIYTELNRQLALEATCRKIADLIKADDDLVQRVIGACQDAARKAQQVDPASLNRRKEKADKLRRQIEFTVQNLGDSEEDEQIAERLLTDLKLQRAHVVAEIKQLEDASNKEVLVPSEAEVRDHLKKLHELFIKAAAGVDDEDAPAVRKVLKMVTGGRIDLNQQGERRPKRGWLKGRFRLRLLRLVLERCTASTLSSDDEGVEVAIDYRQPVSFAKEADEAWNLYEQGKLGREIAAMLRCSRGKVTKLLHHAAKQRGVELVDGRKRRHQLPAGSTEPPLYQRIANEVKRLFDEGLLLQDISERIQCDRNTVTRAIAFWHEERGLPVPDGRTRRKLIPRGLSSPSAGNGA